MSPLTHNSFTSPFTLHPSPFTLHPSPFTLPPSPFTLHPSPFTLQPSTFTPSPLHFSTHSLIHALSNNLKVPLQFPVGDGLAELAFLPFARGGEVLDKCIAETGARG